jgi:hypothetical protein
MVLERALPLDLGAVNGRLRRYPAVSASMNEGPDHIQQQTFAGSPRAAANQRY